MACSLFPCITDPVILISPGCGAPASSPARFQCALQENPVADSSCVAGNPRAHPGSSGDAPVMLRHGPGAGAVAQPGCHTRWRGFTVLPLLFIKGMTAKIHLKMKKVPANPFWETVIDWRLGKNCTAVMKLG